MAFDHNDTDEVYDNCIAKSLRKYDIQPVRIDRKEHNNDIDDEIISELKRCDLIISDLTYARPSVYFEAGFGAGRSAEMKTDNIPVIYTCRRDHFRSKPDDKYGNFRVHFDLQMKNIIRWSNHKDKEFLNKLNKRISHVIKPIIAYRKREHIQSKKEKKFQQRSLKTRIELIFNNAVLLSVKSGHIGIKLPVVSPNEFPFAHNRYRDQPLQIHYPITGFYHQKYKPNLLKPCWIGTKIKSNILSTLYLHTTQSLTKTLFGYLYESLLHSPIYNISLPNKNVKLRKLNENLIINSLKKVDSKGIVDTIEDFAAGKIADEFVWHDTQNVPISKLKRCKMLFASYDNKRHFYSILTKNRDNETHQSYYADNRNNIRTLGDKKRVGKIKNIPRDVHVFVLNDIRSVEDFVSTYRGILHSITSKIDSTN